MEVYCLTVGLLASIVCLVFWRILVGIEAELNYTDPFARLMLYVLGFVSLCLDVFGSVGVLRVLTGSA